MWNSRWRRSNNLQLKRKRPIGRPFLEQLEDRRLLATNITQYHVDSQSTGANLTETQLTSSNVNAADFGQLYNTPLDGQVYAEPLVLTNVTIVAGPNTVGTPGTYDSVVFVATENDSLYAINAANGAILWQRTFLDTTNPNDYLPGATSVSTVSSDDMSSSDIYPEIGITGTPVIDPSTNIIYVSVPYEGTRRLYDPFRPATPRHQSRRWHRRRPVFPHRATRQTITPITHRSTSTARATAMSGAWSSSTPCTRPTAPP